MKQRVALLVYVDLDPVPGAFHTERSARDNVAGILDNQIGHYNPIVSYASDADQPPNRPKPVEDSQEILRPKTPDEPIAGTSPDTVGALTTSQLTMDYTEGTN